MSRQHTTHPLPVAKTWLERNNCPTNKTAENRSKRYADHPTDLLFVDSVDVGTTEIVMLRHDGFDSNGKHIFRRRSVMSFDTWQRNATHYSPRPEPRSPLSDAALSEPPPAPVVASAPAAPSVPTTTTTGSEGEGAPEPTAPTSNLVSSFVLFTGDKASLNKAVVFMIDALGRANFTGPAKDALHEIRKILSEPTMSPLALDVSVQCANRHLANQGIPMVLTLALLAKLPELARFIDGIDVEIQRICPAYASLLSALLSGVTATPAAPEPSVAAPAMLPAPEALVEEITKMPLTHTYPHPFENGGWLGYIEPEDHTWICFVGGDGRALVWTDREPNGQVHGLPAYLYHHNLAHAHIVVSIGSMRDGLRSLKEAIIVFRDLINGVEEAQKTLANDQRKLQESISFIGNITGGGAAAIGNGPEVVRDLRSSHHINPIGPNGKG